MSRMLSTRVEPVPNARKHSSAAFPQAVSELMAEQDVGLRELSRRTVSRYDWGRPATLSLLLRGEMPVTFEGMEMIAAVLEVSPTHFSEYRLEQTRRRLDPRHTPLEKALELDAAVRRLAAYKRA